MQFSLTYRILCIVLSLQMAIGPLLAKADEISDTAQSATSFAKDLLGGMSAPTNTNGEITFSDGESLLIEDLNPMSSSTGKDQSKYFPDDYDSNADGYGDMWDDGSAMDNSGYEAQQSMYSDAIKDNPESIMGQAYKVILDTSERERIDFSNDPALSQTKDIIDDIDTIAEGFSDCSVETIINDTKEVVHIPEYKQCTKVQDLSANCSLRHDYSASVVEHSDGEFGLAQCGEGCTQLYIGKVGDNYWRGSCSIYEQYTKVKVRNPEAITSAVIEYAKWDDYMQIWVGKDGEEQKVWQGPNQNFPPETAGKCELKESWSTNPNTDVTSYFKGLQDGDVLTFKIRVSVSGKGEGYGRIRINYDPAQMVMNDSWSPKNCYDSAMGVQDGFAKGSLACVDDPSNGGQCAVVNGVTVCQNHLAPSPFDGISNLCREVQVEADYDFYKGPMECFTDYEGNLQCPENTGDGDLNTCDELESNPQCGYIKQRCVDGAAGGSGECYVFEETWDCGRSVEIDNKTKEETYKCDGEIRCLGEECTDPASEENLDFAQAAALLQASQFMTQDMECDENDVNQSTSCKVFNGTAGECKQAVGGQFDCCESPATPGIGNYIQMLMLVGKLDSGLATAKGLENTTLQSGYNELRQPVVESWSELTQPFSESVESITGPIDTAAEEVTKYIQDFILEMKQKISEEMTKFFTQEGANIVKEGVSSGSVQLTDEATGKVVEQTFTEQLIGVNNAALLGNVMLAYTAIMITYMALQMIYACEEEEMELTAKRELKSCSYVGSYCSQDILGVCTEKQQAYCCFNSPLSRIIQEQVNLQNGWDFGSPENPQCQGIALEDVGDIDWQKVDLSEWLGLMVESGIGAADNMNMEALTGSGNAFNMESVGGERRLNTIDRTQQRMDEVDVDSARHKISNSMDLYKGE